MWDGEEGEGVSLWDGAVLYHTFPALCLRYSIGLSTGGYEYDGKLYEHCTALGLACAVVGLCAADGMNLYDYRTML